MVFNHLALPEYKVSNPWDTTPIYNALDQNQRLGQQQRQFDATNKLQQAQLGIQQERLGMERESHGVQMQSARTQQELQEARMAAGRVQGIMQLPAEQRAAAWAVARRQKGFSDLPAEFDNFEFAAPQILSRAQEYLSPMDKAKMGNINAQTGLYRAQARAAGQKSELEGAISDVIRGNLSGGPPAASPPPQGGIQPQSYGGAPPATGMQPAMAQGPAQMPQGAPPAGDPNLILAQTASQPSPQAPPNLSPGQDIVETPMGRMTRERARQLGFALALGGKGDAGKMMGDAAGQGMPGKEARNEIEKKLFAATEQKARLAGIRQKFKPEWQTIDGQLKQYGISWADSIGPLRNRIPPAIRAQHAEYSQYRQEAYQNINLYIKEITGAQMSEAEASRLRKAVPDPDKDGPTAFEAKLENLTAQTDLAAARYYYLLRRGFQGMPWESGISLERMQGIINDRGRQIESMIRSANPQAPDQAVQRETFRLVKQEFGI